MASATSRADLKTIAFKSRIVVCNLTKTDEKLINKNSLLTSMKVNFKMKSFKSYLMELIIVTAGVLIALILSNMKENNQAKKYYKASIETINNEVEINCEDIKGVIEKQMALHDTLLKYIDEPLVIGEIIAKSGGLKATTLNHSGLELYKSNQISSIDFELMSTLNNMNNLSKLIETKMNRLVDFGYRNILDSSKNSKMVLSLHIQDALGSEKKLMELYKNYIEKKQNYT